MKSIVKTLATFLAVSAFCLAATNAGAGEGPPVNGVGTGRPSLDTNGDGAVDFTELQAHRPNVTPAEFTAIDSNGDGQLSKEELRAARPKHLRPHIDTDGDGAITFAELQAVRPQLTEDKFKQLDSDGDGTLSRDEMHSAMKQHRAEMEKARAAEREAAPESN